MIEPLEARQFLSASAAPAASVLDAALQAAPIQMSFTNSGGGALTSARAGALAKPQHASSVIPLTITGIVNQAGQLIAQGLLGSHAFTAPIDLTATPNANMPSCPILNLHLGEIHLNLLGLTVDTSEICLDITANPGPGQLLGNLLCDVANLLNGGSPLSTILGGLSSTNLSTLLNGLTGLLGSVFSQLTAPGAVSGVSGSTPGACDILNLSLGPVDLNLLGLEVHLDNCHNGPVTVDVGAQEGPGNLLGNLLCTLSHLLDNGANANAINNLIGRISDILNGALA